MSRIITEQEYEALNTLLQWAKENLDRQGKRVWLPGEREGLQDGRYLWKVARRGIVKIGRTLSPTNPEKQAR